MINGFRHNNNLIVINADDFGYNQFVNQAIYKSFQLGLIQSTSLFVNMEGTDQAIGMIRSNPYISSNIGLHLNLTEGFPLTEDIRYCPRFCDGKGEYFYTREKPLIFLSPQEKKAIYKEMRAQMNAILSAGIVPHHLDSHHHVHTEWPILRLMVRLAKEYGVKKVRLARNMGKQRSYFKMRYKSLLNSYLRFHIGMENLDLFGNMEDFENVMKNKLIKDKSIEVMVHPTINDFQDIIDDNGNTLQDKLMGIIPNFKLKYNFAE